jgi:hypothetical protein
MLLAAALLRRGDDVDRIAAVSGVPPALELMTSELSGTDADCRFMPREGEPSAAHQTHPAAPPEA